MRFHVLVFGKTVFSNGRGCSVTESFLIACISLVNEPDKYGEIIAVVYEHMKRTQEMLFADWAQ